MTRRWLGIGAVAAVLVAATWVSTAGPADAGPDSKARTVLNDVHTDAVDVRYVDGRLALRTRVGSAPYQFYEPGEVIFQVRDAARMAVPDMPEYAFLGPSDSPVWIAPQVQDPALLFAGWDTEGVPVGVLAGDSVDLHLRGVSGPGRVEVFQTDGVGRPLRIFSSADSAHTSRREAVGEGHHVHANWSFSARGRYRLTFEVTATTTAGAALSSGPVEYTWYVGGTNPEDIVPDPVTTTPTVTSTATLTPTVDNPPAPTSTKAASRSTNSVTTTSCVPKTTRTGVVLDQGHVDYAARIVDGRLVSQVKDGTTGTTPQWRAPGQVVFHLKSAAATTVPSDAFPFLGPASTRIWQIPQTQKADVVWLGWNTEAITAAQATGEVKWQLTEVSGPGSMAIYELDPFGKPVVIFNSKDGLPDTHIIRLGTHAHGNWAFTAAGAYRLTFVHTVTLASGTTVSDKQVVTFAVGDMDPRTLLPTSTTGCGANGGTSTDAAGRLANTGGSVLTPLAAGAVLVLVGGGLVFLPRRLRARVSARRTAGSWSGRRRA